jgi:transposase
MSHTSSPPPLDARFLPDLPWCLIGDRGYDSDGLDDLLMTQYGIEMIAANRRGRAKTQDGRPLRRAKRRWKIERLFAWLHNCRRVVTRWERHSGTTWAWCSSPVPGSCSGHL